VHLRTGAITNPQRAMLLALAGVASVLSYRYVETPFRRRPARRDARGTLKAAAFGMAVVAALAVAVPLAVMRGRSGAARADKILAWTQYPAEKVVRSGVCFLTTGYSDQSLFRNDLCLALRPDRKNVLVMGDSHAAHLWMGLHEARPDINFMQATASGCG